MADYTIPQGNAVNIDFTIPYSTSSGADLTLEFAQLTEYIAYRFFLVQ